jgi:hypothetical protein
MISSQEVTFEDLQRTAIQVWDDIPRCYGVQAR